MERWVDANGAIVAETVHHKEQYLVLLTDVSAALVRDEPRTWRAYFKALKARQDGWRHEHCRTSTISE